MKAYKMGAHYGVTEKKIKSENAAESFGNQDDDDDDDDDDE